MEFFRFILKRILQTIPLLIIVSIISFFIIRLSPVDPLAELKLNALLLHLRYPLLIERNEVVFNAD